MMLRKLRLYLWWKGKLSERKRDGRTAFAHPESGKRASDGSRNQYGGGEDISAALKKKDKERAERSAGRRRVRGGAPAASSNTRVKVEAQDTAIIDIVDDAGQFAEL